MDSDESSHESVSEHKIKMNKKIFTENELNNTKGMQQAFKVINTLINDGTKHAISAQAKSCYKIGTKQLKIILPVFERKMELIAELETKVKTMMGEMTSLKFDQQQLAHNKTQLRQLLSDNQQLREELEKLHHELLMERQKLIKAKNEAEQQQKQQQQQKSSTSRHVSIQLPEDATSSNTGGDAGSIDAMRVSSSLEEVPEINVSYTEVQPDNSGMLEEGRESESVDTMRENLKKKLSSRRNVLQPGSRGSSRNVTSQLSKGSVTAPLTPISAAKLSKLELYDYDSESVSSHEQFESVVKKSEHQQTDQFRQQIHMLREELRQSDDRYYEQRAELENLRQIVASQSAGKPSNSAIKEKEIKYEKTIEKLQMAQRLLKKEVTDKQDDLTSKQRIIETLQQQLRELIKEHESRKSISNGSAIEKPASPPRVTIPISTDIEQMPRDQLIKKITRQSEVELNRLRKFIIHEQQRFQANLRRSNLESTKQFSKLRSEHVHLVRGITHFKETVNKLLRGESMEEESTSSMSVISNINTGGDLGGIDGTVENLVALERRLYNIFMHNKLTLKHNNATKSNTEKELESCRTQLQKRNAEYTDQQQLVKRVEVRNEVLSRQCKQLAYVNHSLQRELEPCKEIIKKYQSIQEKVEMLRCNEKEQQRETRQLTKDLEADRNRLKKEVNQLMLAQICPLRKNAPNQLWSRLKCSQKKVIVEKAHSMNQLTDEHKAAGTEILDFCNQLAVQQLADLMTRYMDLCKFKRINDTIKAAAVRYNHDIRFSTYLELMVKRHHEAKSIWKEHCDAVREERERAFLILKQVLGDSWEDFVVPSIQLSKPTYAKPLKHQQETPGNLPMTSSCSTNSSVTSVIGQCMVTGNNSKQKYWQIPPALACPTPGNSNMAKITVPRILAMDIEKCRQPRLVAQKVKSYLPPIAEMFP